MITRIVKLTFREEEVEGFIEYFHTVCNTIRNQPGCNHLQVWRGKQADNIIFTYSLWDSEEHLNAYRDSEFFGVFWKKTKAMFKEKADAWSFDKILELP